MGSEEQASAAKEVSQAKWWSEISPYLDEALTLSRENRTAWLESIRVHDSAIADRVADVLSEYYSLLSNDYLEGRLNCLPKSGPRNGEIIGSYRLISSLGEGGMGSVWLAERSDQRFERKVAVKFLNLNFANRGSEERFKREGTILAKLSYPLIARLIDAGVSDHGTPYLVLEHVAGKHIDQHCDSEKLDLEARLSLFLDVLAAVAHAHANLIVHRDIKPSNVLVTASGEVKLLDFGVAKLLAEEGAEGPETQFTREVGAALTPAYAAPEQLTGAPVTTATDVYALGVLLFTLLTGQHPSGSTTQPAASLLKFTLELEAPRMSSVLSSADDGPALASSRSTTPEKLCHKLRGDLDTIVAKALKKHPQERYASVTAFADDIRRYLDNLPIAAQPDTFRYRTAKFLRRHRLEVSLALLAVLTAVAGLVGTGLQAHSARVERDFALRQLSRAETINDLNSFLLSDAAPSGKPFTVNELLHRAENIVEQQHGHDQIGRIELLISVGRQYWSQDQDSSAIRVLESAYQLSRKVSDSSVRARAACALASALARGRDLRRAETLFQEGVHTASYNLQLTVDRIFCLKCGSEIARETGANTDAILRAKQAQSALEQSPLRSELERLHVLMQLAESYRTAGQYKEADTAFEQAAAIMNSLGRSDTQMAGTLLNNWGLSVQFLGRPLEAEKLFRRAIAISSSDGKEQSVSPMLFVNESRALRDLAHFREAAIYAEKAYAEGKKAGDQVIVNQSLISAASVYRGAGDIARASLVLAELEPRLRAALPAGHYAFASLDSEKSMLAQEKGDFAHASELANRAVNLLEEKVRQGDGQPDFLAVLLMRRSALELKIGRLREADADARRALALALQTADGVTLSSYIGTKYLALGRVLMASKKKIEARTTFELALKHLNDSLGPDHPDSLAARQLMAECR
jgi:eukaryotic-like serine/threonine-protein kinase